ARSIASPLNRPASAIELPSVHRPTESSTRTPHPSGPTTTKLHRCLRSGRPIDLRTISGPIPRGSPNVSASVGNRSTSVVRALEPDGDVRRLPQLVDQPPHRTLLRELIADRRPEIIEREVAAFAGLNDLRDDELRHTAHRIGNRKRTDERA